MKLTKKEQKRFDWMLDFANGCNKRQRLVFWLNFKSGFEKFPETFYNKLKEVYLSQN